MTLDANARRQRAIKAAEVASSNRWKATRERNKGIVAAYLWLSNSSIAMCPKKRNAIYLQAIHFLTEHGAEYSPPDGVGVLRYLAQVTGLTKQRIFAIIKTENPVTVRKPS
jgi:hypothetical protein